MENTIYTITVWFKDRNGGEHENTIVCKGQNTASEFVFTTQIAMTKLRKLKAIGAHSVICNPPLPR